MWGNIRMAVDTSEPLAPGSRFIIGSVTKQFAGMCIMLLKDKELLKYEEPIGRKQIIDL